MQRAGRDEPGRKPLPGWGYTAGMILTGGAALAACRLAFPDRTDLLAAAAAGAGFAALAGAAGETVVRRAALRAPAEAVRAFLAAMTVKMIGFAAFLLTIALTTSLNLAALAAGMVIMILAGEALTIAGLRRMSAGAGPAGPEQGGDRGGGGGRARATGD